MHPRLGPFGVTRDKLVAIPDGERPLPVDEDPRHEYADRKQPDGTDCTHDRKRRHFSRRGMEHL